MSWSSQFTLEQDHGSGLEQSTSTTKSRSKHLRQCSARGLARATAPAQSWSPDNSPSWRFCAKCRGIGGQLGGQERGNKVYKEERSGSGSGKAAHAASKNKHTASSHTLSFKHFSRTSSHCPPDPENTKQCCQTPSSPTASRATEARPRTSAGAPATEVARSTPAPADTTPPQRPSRKWEPARRPRPTPMTQSTARKTDRLPRAHSLPRAFRIHPMSTTMSYTDPSQPLSKPSADVAPQWLPAQKASQPHAPAR